MASIKCKCGHVMSDFEVPNDVRIWAYTDNEWSQKLSSTSRIIDLPLPKHDVWYCVKCERLHIFREGQKTKTFKLEENHRDW